MFISNNQCMPNPTSDFLLSAPQSCALTCHLLCYYLLCSLGGSLLVTTEDAKIIVNDFSPANIITAYLYAVASEI